MAPTVDRLALIVVLAAALTACFTTERGEPPHTTRDDARASGAGCTWNVDCASAFCIPEQAGGQLTGWPGGMCSALCVDRPCETGQRCVALDDANYCLPPCATNDDCRTGYVCSTDIAVCLPDCRLGWSCGELACSAATGACGVETITPGDDIPGDDVPGDDVPGDTRALGQPCVANEECTSGTCLLQAGGTWPNGICTLACAGTCPAAFTCASVVSGSLLCLPACGSGQLCPAGYVCDAFQDACVPSCQQGWICPEGTCRASGLCRTGSGPGATG